MKKMKTAIELIAAEIKRSAEKYGYTDEHIKSTPEDYGVGELAIAAAAYLTTGIEFKDVELPMSLSEYIFPWDLFFFKPSLDDRIKDLVKAGAMIVKEINRLQS